jgi:molecular chaperone GrpE
MLLKIPICLTNRDFFMTTFQAQERIYDILSFFEEWQYLCKLKKKKIAMSKKQDITSEELKDNQVENTTPEQPNETLEEEATQEPTEPSLEDKLKEANDKFIRLYAEFENFRKRTNKEKVDLLSHAGEGVIKDMLPILDDLERAIENNSKIEDVAALKEGFQLIFSKLKHTMDMKGVKQMETKGTPFDSELHEAIANIPAPSEDLKGKIVEDVEKGYYLNDKVIRFAKVVVGQ